MKACLIKAKEIKIKLGNVFVLNLSERKDRWDFLIDVWQNTFTFYRITAIKNTDGNIGCMLSHLKAIKLAKEHKMPYILVWEDDVLPWQDTPKNIYKRWCHLETELIQCKDWSIISGGADVNWTKNIQKIQHPLLSETLFEVDSGFLTHFVCYSYRIYDILLSDLQNGLTMLYDQYLYFRFRPWVVMPFLATQRDGYSSCERRFKSIQPNMVISHRRLWWKRHLSCKVKRFTT